MLSRTFPEARAVGPAHVDGSRLHIGPAGTTPVGEIIVGSLYTEGASAAQAMPKLLIFMYFEVLARCMLGLH